MDHRFWKERINLHLKELPTMMKFFFSVLKIKCCNTSKKKKHCNIYGFTAFSSLPLGNFACFIVFCWFFSKSTFSKNSFRNTFRVSSKLDTDQSRHFVGPDLGPNYLQRLTADDTSRQIWNLSDKRPTKAQTRLRNCSVLLMPFPAHTLNDIINTTLP